MGAPILPAPTPTQQANTAANATFGITSPLPSLPKFTTPGGVVSLGASTPTVPFYLCGLKLPSIGFSLSFTIPQFTIDLSLLFGIALSISCDGVRNGHPLNFTADVPWGGGRVPTSDPDPDDEP